MQTTRILATSLIAIAFPFFSSQTLQAQETERFGLRMGMEKAEVIASVGPNAVEKGLGDVLILATTPKLDASFVSYVVLVPPETGVTKVVAISNDVTTNSSGESLRDKFNELRSSLEANYGKAALVFDFLIPESSWSKPNVPARDQIARREVVQDHAGFRTHLLGVQGHQIAGLAHAPKTGLTRGPGTLAQLTALADEHGRSGSFHQHAPAFQIGEDAANHGSRQRKALF